MGAGIFFMFSESIDRKKKKAAKVTKEKAVHNRWNFSNFSHEDQKNKYFVDDITHSPNKKKKITWPEIDSNLLGQLLILTVRMFSTNPKN